MASGHHGELDLLTLWYPLTDDVQVLWGTVMYVLCYRVNLSAVLTPIPGR